MTHNVIIHCNGVGPVIRKDTLEIPHYENGIAMVAWAPPDDMSEHKKAKHDKVIEKHRQAILKEIAKATGGEIYEAPS